MPGHSHPNGRRWPRVIAVLIRVLLPAALVMAALAVQLGDPPFRARLRDHAFDQLQSLAPRPYRDELPVRVVAIDEASLTAIGQWPWPRTVLAAIVDRLVELGARVVVFDIVMPEADRTSPEQVAAWWPENPALQSQLRHLPTHDRVLADSISRGKVALAFSLDPLASNPLPPPAKARFLSFGGEARDWLPSYAGSLASLATLTQAASGSGAISLAPGRDGVLRAMPLLYQVRDSLYPSLSLEALRLFHGQDNLSLQLEAHGTVPGIQGIGLGDGAFLPTAADGRVWLHFHPYSGERYLSAQDLLAGKVAGRLVKDHIVFIGATAQGLGDTLYSPLGEVIPGVEGHLQLAEQLLAGDYLLRPPWENDAVAVLLLASWLSLGVLLARSRPVWSVLLAVCVVAGIAVFSWWLFTAQRLLFDPSYPALAVAALFMAMVVPRHLHTEWQQRWIRAAFSRYVSPNRVRHLLAHPQDLELGGVYRECSFVMTDLEGYTPLMEKYLPGQLAGLLNDYLDGMIQIAFRHDGTLDRIVGDAVAVMFSAPLVQADHAARALACALEMEGFAREFSRAKEEQGIPFGRTRIGVNTGTVLVGNFGGKAMMDYRALGDAINTAARLESINAQLGTHVCVSGATVAQCPDFSGRPVGRLLLKGKSEAVAVYEPLSDGETGGAPIAAYLAAYALLEAESPDANQAFRELAQAHPDDPLAAYHAQRLANGENGTLVTMKSK